MTNVFKRNTYSIMKSTKPEERGQLFAKMLLENPKLLKYFTRKNPFVRMGEASHIILSNEQYSRKEELRAALYPVAEPHLEDGEMTDVNIEGEVKELLKGASDYINTNYDTAKDEKAKKVKETLDKVIKSEIDSSKIVKNKEWYRGILRWLAGATAALAVLIATVPEFKPQQEGRPNHKVEKVMTNDNKNCDEVMKSLNVCMDALGEKCPHIEKIVTQTQLKEVPIVKEIPLIVKVPIEKEIPLIVQQLPFDYDMLKKDAASIVAFKARLMKKIDYIFTNMGVEADQVYYKSTVRPWFKSKLDAGDIAMIEMAIWMGGDLLGVHMDGDTVTKVTRIKNPQEFAEFYKNKMLLYAGGQSGNYNEWALKKGMVKAAWELYKEIYNEFRNFLR